MKDSLGDRMKGYEVCSKTSLPKRTPVIIRIDGKAFHTYTKGCERPFDQGLMDDMNDTTKYLCKNIQGAKFGYVQSDEISILLTDYETVDTQGWFEYEVQKIVSVAASMATSKFNQLRTMRVISETEDGNFIKDYIESMRLAEFDARVFSITDPFEVANYFIWRQKDATRNSISMAAQFHCGHDATLNKSSDEKQEMIFQKTGVNWNDYPERFKRGAIIRKVEYEKDGNKRNKWDNVPTPIFTKEQGFLYSQIPVISGASKVISLTELYNRTVEDGTSQICKLCNSKTGPDHVGGCDRDKEKGCAWNNNKQ